MTHEFNVGLGVATTEVLTYGGEMPRSQGDVKRLLFSDLMTEMEKGESTEFRCRAFGCGSITFQWKDASRIGSKTLSGIISQQRDTTMCWGDSRRGRWLRQLTVSTKLVGEPP